MNNTLLLLRSITKLVLFAKDKVSIHKKIYLKSRTYLNSQALSGRHKNNKINFSSEYLYIYKSLSYFQNELLVTVRIITFNFRSYVKTFRRRIYTQNICLTK